jgi:hypothetical protein
MDITFDLSSKLISAQKALTLGSIRTEEVEPNNVLSWKRLFFASYIRPRIDLK